MANYCAASMLRKFWRWLTNAEATEAAEHEVNMILLHQRLRREARERAKYSGRDLLP